MNSIWLIEYKNWGGLNWKPLGTEFYHCKRQSIIAKKICESGQKDLQPQQKKHFRVMRYEAVKV